MSEAAEEALREAVADVERMKQRMKTVDHEVAARTAAIRSAQELVLIRGEMRAIRILLSEAREPVTGLTGFDSGNA